MPRRARGASGGCAARALIIDRDITRSLSHDEAEWAPVGEALARIRATSSDQVAATVQICARFRVPVTARGAGTGLPGGANAIDGGVIIALDRLDQIRLIDPLERLAVVQAGVINAASSAPHHRRIFQLDPRRRRGGTGSRRGRHHSIPLELVDRRCLAAVDKWKNLGLSVEADVVLLGRIDDPGLTGDDLADEMLARFEAAGATWAARSSDEEEAEALFATRRLAYPALERLGPVLTEDVCVPIAAVPEILARIDQIASEHDILIASIAHIGDGNLHPLLIADPGDTAARDRAKIAVEEILSATLDHGGTVTGEHGVCLLKRGGLSRSSPLPFSRCIVPSKPPSIRVRSSIPARSCDPSNE